MELERLTDPGAWLGEGASWDSSSETLLWVDILGRSIHRTDPRTGTTSYLETPSEVGAVVLAEDDQLVAAMVDGIYRHSGSNWDLIRLLESDRPENRANDGKVDPFGALVVGTMPWNGDRPTGSLYRVQPNGKIEVLLTGLSISNGLAWWGEHFWHIDSQTKLLTQYRYEPEGSLRPTGVQFKVEPPGGPDGMTVDEEGFLWVAMWGGAAVRRYRSDGTLVAEISIPTSHVSSCTFGGSDLGILFITTATKDLAAPEAEPLAGSVFAVRPGTNGLDPSRFRALPPSPHLT